MRALLTISLRFFASIPDGVFSAKSYCALRWQDWTIAGRAVRAGFLKKLNPGETSHGAQGQCKGARNSQDNGVGREARREGQPGKTPEQLHVVRICGF